MRVLVEKSEKLTTRRSLYCIWEVTREGERTCLVARWIDPDAPVSRADDDTHSDDDEEASRLFLCSVLAARAQSRKRSGCPEYRTPKVRVGVLNWALKRGMGNINAIAQEEISNDDGGDNHPLWAPKSTFSSELDGDWKCQTGWRRGWDSNPL
jgi:hypothetical protein